MVVVVSSRGSAVVVVVVAMAVFTVVLTYPWPRRLACRPYTTPPSFQPTPLLLSLPLSLSLPLTQPQSLSPSLSLSCSKPNVCRRSTLPFKDTVLEERLYIPHPSTSSPPPATLPQPSVTPSSQRRSCSCCLLSYKSVIVIPPPSTAAPSLPFPWPNTHTHTRPRDSPPVQHLLRSPSLSLFALPSTTFSLFHGEFRLRTSLSQRRRFAVCREGGGGGAMSPNRSDVISEAPLLCLVFLFDVFSGSSLSFCVCLSV